MHIVLYAYKMKVNGEEEMSFRNKKLTKVMAAVLSGAMLMSATPKINIQAATASVTEWNFSDVAFSKLKTISSNMKVNDLNLRATAKKTMKYAKASVKINNIIRF